MAHKQHKNSINIKHNLLKIMAVVIQQKDKTREEIRREHVQ
jgi:hypothetical protein